MARFVVARQLGGKRAITTTGKEIGRLDDIMVDEGTGQMEALVIEPDAETAEDLRFSKDAEGNFIINYKSVKAISDVIVIEEAPSAILPQASTAAMPLPRHPYHHTTTH